MCKILIVDDEPATRNTLKKLIDCFQQKYEIIGEAANGFQALNLIKEKKPDIVILDIRMPEINGITLLEKLRKQNINCKVIILTAYDNFNYARDALKFSAFDYLLKPVKREDLQKVLGKASLIIKKEKESLDREFTMKILLDKSTKAYRDAVLNQLIDGDNYDKLANDIPIIFPREIEYAAITVFNIFCDTSEKTSRLKEIRRYIENELSSYIKGYCFFDKDNRLVLLNTIDNEYNIDENVKFIQYTIKAAKGYSIPAGIGRIYKDLRNIYKSYSEACIALEYRFTSVDKNIIYFTDCKYSNAGYVYPLKAEDLLLNSLILGDKDSVLSNINQFFDEITREGLNPATVKQICMQLGISVLKKVKEFNIPIHLLNITDNHFFDMSRYETINDFRNNLIMNTYKIIKYLNENKELRNKFEFKEIVDKYLESNFSRNIGLLDIANEFGITPNYFSSLFKKEVGENFVEYLTRYRIKIAKEILASKNTSVSKVAEMVGYTDVKYFFRVFKKYEGVTPKKFKQHVKLIYHS